MSSITPPLCSSDDISTLMDSPIVVGQDTPILDVIDLMRGFTEDSDSSNRSALSRQAHSSCVLIEEGDCLLGIFTEHDVVRLCAKRQPLETLSIGECMTTPVITLHYADCSDVFSAMKFLRRQNIRQAPVLGDDGRLMGLLSCSYLFHNAAFCSALTATSSIGIFRMTPQGSHTYVNERWSEILGVDPVQAPGLGWLERVHPSDREWVTQTWINSLKQKISFELEYRIQTFSGTPRWIHVQTLAEQGLEETVSGYVGTVTDISDRKQAEQALQAQVKFDRLVAKIAREFIQFAPQDTSDRINWALQELGTFTQIDTSCIFRYDWDNSTQSMTHEWVASGFSPNISNVQDLPVDCFPWATQLICQGEIIHIPTIHGLPPEAQIDQKGFQQFGIESVLGIPLVSQGQVHGLVCFASFHQEQQWTKNNIRLLKVFADILSNVLQRQKAEVKWDESEKRYASLAKAAPVGIFRTNLDGDKWYVNDRWCHITGISLKQLHNNQQTCDPSLPFLQDYQNRNSQIVGDLERLFYLSLEEKGINEGSQAILRIGTNDDAKVLLDRQLWKNVVHPDDYDRVSQAWDHALDSHGFFHQEFRFIHPTDDIVWTLGQAVPEYDAFHNVIGYVGTLTDITEAKHQEQKRRFAEAALQQSEANLKLFIKYTPVGIAMLDSDLCYLSASQRWIEDYHLNSIESILGRSHYEIFPNASERWRTIHQACLNGKIERCEEELFERTNGTKLWLRWEIRPWFRQSQEVGGIIIFAEDISDRKQAQVCLQESEERLRLALGATSQGLYDLNLKTGKAIVTPEYATMLGYDPSSFRETNADWVERLHPDDRDQTAKIYAAYVAGNIPDYKVEFRQRTKTGDWKWILSLGKIVAWDETGEPLRMLGTHTDISDRKQAEIERLRARTLQIELTLLESILDNVLAGYWDWDIQNNQEYLSSGFKRMFGYEGSELPNSPESWQSLIFSEDLSKVLANFEEHVQSHGQVPYYNEVRYRHKDGSTIWVICSGLVIEWDSDCKPIRMIGCHIDITQRKEAEAKLSELSNRLSLAIQSAEIGIWDWNLVENILTWDERMCALYGVASHQFENIYEGWLRRVHPEDQLAASNAIDRAIAQEKQYDLEFRVVHPDKTIRYIKASALVERDSEGKPKRMVGVNYDITDQKQAEATIKQTASQLAAINQELESFSYSVSHDLRAPLRHISGFVNALKQQLSKHAEFSDPSVTRYLQVIDNSSQKMGQLIDGLLTLSRMGRRPLEWQPIDLNELILDLIQIVQSEIMNGKAIDFVIGDLPIIEGDRTLIQQIFQNLIENSVKFCRDTPTPRIEINSNADGIIFIRDNGAGFQMKYADKLFGAFQRLHSQSEFEGTGIGLALVQRIVQRHGGKIWAEAIPQQGATFYLNLGKR